MSVMLSDGIGATSKGCLHAPFVLLLLLSDESTNRQTDRRTDKERNSQATVVVAVASGTIIRVTVELVGRRSRRSSGALAPASGGGPGSGLGVHAVGPLRADRGAPHPREVVRGEGPAPARSLLQGLPLARGLVHDLLLALRRHDDVGALPHQLRPLGPRRARLRIHTIRVQDLQPRADQRLRIGDFSLGLSRRPRHRLADVLTALLLLLL